MVTKYISLDDAIKLLRKAETGYRNRMVSQVRADMIAHCIKLICELPAADVRPVVRGKWIDKGVRAWACSCCGVPLNHIRQFASFERDELPRFCPNCGADMREPQMLKNASQNADADVMMPAT